ncbi:MAG: hypothetical protein NXI00_23985 [Cytophagales bacterium]|nr:hypothetical protein [Cytophagales bacterium]
MKQIHSFYPARLVCSSSHYLPILISFAPDGCIYLWQRSGQLLEVISGHDSPVNCIKWNKNGTEPLFASGGDDKQVIIWGTTNKESALSIVK